MDIRKLLTFLLLCYIEQVICETTTPAPCILKPCASNEYCMSTTADPGYQCFECDKSCKACFGAGNTQCNGCKVGYVSSGSTCTACAVGKFGTNCTGTCHCLNLDKCQKGDGICDDLLCDFGYSGSPYCQEACDSQHFGRDCTYECHCPVGDNCSSINGVCSSGSCHPEWGGAGCQTRLPKLVTLPKAESVVCRNLTVTWLGWVKDFDIGDGPAGKYSLVLYRNSTGQWQQVSTPVLHTDSAVSYKETVTNLFPDEWYKFRVDIYRKDGTKFMHPTPGLPSDFVFIPCSVTVVQSTTPQPVTKRPPGKHLLAKLEVDLVGDQTAEVKWTLESNLTAYTLNITVIYKMIFIGDCQQITDATEMMVSVGNTSGSVNITDLEFFRQYHVKVYAEVSEFDKYDFIEYTLKTKEVAPTGKVSNIQESVKESRQITIRWNNVQCDLRGGILVKFLVKVVDKKNLNIPAVELETNQTSLVITNLSPYRQYDVTVSYINKVSSGPESSIFSFETEQDVPSSPTIDNHGAGETSIELTLLLPSELNGILREYQVTYSKTSDFLQSLSMKNSTEYTTFVIDGLVPFTQYFVKVQARTDAGWGPYSDVVSVDTKEDYPEEPASLDSHINTTCLDIFWAPPGVINGALLGYKIMYRQLTSGTDLTQSSTVAATVQAKTICNLQPATWYKVEVSAQTSRGFGKAVVNTFMTHGVGNSSTPKPTEETTSPLPEEGNSTGLIVGIVITLIVLIIIIILIIIFICYKRRQKPPPYIPYSNPKDIQLPVITNDYDPSKYWNKIYSLRESRYIVAGRDLLVDDPAYQNGVTPVVAGSGPPISFEKEFKNLPHGQSAPCTTAKKQANASRNRFPHLLPYDHSRVILQPDENSNNEYINANYIDGYKRPQGYIAAQSPFDDDTALDFWRLIYQKNIQTVVMITHVIEDNIVKCTQFWPEMSGKVTFGSYVMELVDRQDFADYVIRTINIKILNTKKSAKSVTLFEFTGWPNHGVPDDTIPLIEMRDKVREFHGDDPRPILVHCGTGVSRSGSYIAIDALLDQYSVEGRCSVFSFVRKMRKDRVWMVRTIKQYTLIYEAVFEAFVAGNTLVGQDLKEIYKKLLLKNPRNDKTYIHGQFQSLQEYTRPINRDQCKMAVLPINKDKNRFPDIIPADEHRPVLITPGGLERTDYINAVCLDSHRMANHFILTQLPLHSTVIDFWKLVYDYNIETIVMFDPIDDSCPQYWPDKDIKQYQPFFVENTVTYQQQNIVISNLKLSNSTRPTEKPRMIRHFLFTSWGGNKSVPESKSDLLDLVDVVEDWQNFSSEGLNPIAVHCRDGATQSGLFCAASNLCEKMHEERQVDLYHTVKHLKRRRSQIVNNLSHDVIGKVQAFHSILYRHEKSAPLTPTENDERTQFKLLVDNQSTNRMLVFATDSNLRMLTECDTVYDDCTFYTCPSLFAQLFTLHGFVNGRMYPLVFALLPGKSEIIYINLFTELKNACSAHEMMPNIPILYADFEVAIHNAAKFVFPDIIVEGCSFFYIQCVWRNVQKLGLQGLDLQCAYKDDDAFHQLVRRVSYVMLF